jgi:hypothetical protein
VTSVRKVGFALIVYHFNAREWLVKSWIKPRIGTS